MIFNNFKINYTYESSTKIKRNQGNSINASIGIKRKKRTVD